MRRKGSLSRAHLKNKSNEYPPGDAATTTNIKDGHGVGGGNRSELFLPELVKTSSYQESTSIVTPERRDTDSKLFDSVEVQSDTSLQKEDKDAFSGQVNGLDLEVMDKGSDNGSNSATAKGSQFRTRRHCIMTEV